VGKLVVNSFSKGESPEDKLQAGKKAVLSCAKDETASTLGCLGEGMPGSGMRRFLSKRG
jgi:hypothetical protein